MNDLDIRDMHWSSHPDEIAVDLRYRDLVISHLSNVDADDAATRGELEPRLDLALITLLAPTRTATKFAARHGEPEPPGDLGRPAEIDIILHGLRRDIGARYGGWFPRMGKVRNADVVGGLPHTGSHWEYPSNALDREFALRPPTSPEGRDVTVGVLDGPMYPHAKLSGRWTTPDQDTELPEAGSYPWLSGHAAFVAGRLLVRAPGARLRVRGVLRGEVPRATVWDVAKAMADALDDGVQVLNLSLGCFTADGQPPFVLNRAVEVLSGRGVAVVAAAGNHNRSTIPGITPSSPIFPAACPGAVAVGAYSTTDTGGFKPAPFSPQAPWVSLGAPGHEVVSTYLSGKVLFGEQLPGLPMVPADAIFNGYARWSGTSFATATVSGDIARLMSGSGMTALEAVAELRGTNPLTNDGIGWYP